MNAEMVTDANRLVSFQWFGRRGYEYTLQSSVDLENWQDIGNYYGSGATFSVPVYQMPDPVTGTGGGAPPMEMRSAYFTLRYFEGLSKTLVAWKEPGMAAPVKVVIPSDFSDVGSLPLFLDTYDDPVTGIRYGLAFSTWPGVWSSDFDAFTTALLTPEQQEKLSWFTGRDGAIHAAMLATGDPPGVVPAPPVAGVGAHHFIVCEENAVDSDGDGLFDHFEDKFGTDWALTDSDGDGYDDYTEVIAGYDPHDPASNPGSGAPTVPNPEDDDDEDGLLNGVDFDPLDPNINWPKTPPPSYIFFQISGASGLTPVAVNNKGQVLLNGEDKDPAHTRSAFVWSPGDTAPQVLAKGTLLLTVSTPNESVQLIPTAFPVVGTEGADLNDNGAVVGKGFFNLPGGTGSTTTTSPPSPSPPSTIALKWAAPNDPAAFLHWGKKFLGPAKGDFVLGSAATLINNLGDVIGTADTHYLDPALTPADTSANLPTRWKLSDHLAPGTPIYVPLPATEAPAAKRDVTIHRLFEDHFYPTGAYEEPNSNASLASQWIYLWSLAPGFVFSGWGEHAFDTRFTPNKHFTVVTDQRLVLWTKGGAYEPSLRRYTASRYLTSAGTIWTSDLKLIHATEEIDLVSHASVQGFQLVSIADVAANGLAVAMGNLGPLLMLPIDVVAADGNSKVSSLRVAHLADEGVIRAPEWFEPLHLDADPSRFHLRILAGAVLGNVGMRVSTTDNPKSVYDDPATEIDMVIDGSSLISGSAGICVGLRKGSGWLNGGDGDQRHQRLLRAIARRQGAVEGHRGEDPRGQATHRGARRVPGGHGVDRPRDATAGPRARVARTPLAAPGHLRVRDRGHRTDPPAEAAFG